MDTKGEGLIGGKRVKARGFIKDKPVINKQVNSDVSHAAVVIVSNVFFYTFAAPKWTKTILVIFLKKLNFN